MASLIDSSLWIDLTRARSPRTLKAFIAPFVNDAQACVAEPIAFEVLRHATDAETPIWAGRKRSVECSRVSTVSVSGGGLASSTSPYPPIFSFPFPPSAK